MCPSGIQNIVTLTQVHSSQGGVRSEKLSVLKAVVSAAASSKPPNFHDVVGDCPLDCHNLQTEVKTKVTPTASEAAATTTFSASCPTRFLSMPRQKVPPIIMCDQFEWNFTQLNKGLNAKCQPRGISVLRMKIEERFKIPLSKITSTFKFFTRKQSTT